MTNYGDITLIKGSSVPAAEVVIGGSPCQNLSIAGNRMGLQGSESRLFHEQIRLIKEMRENDRYDADGREKRADEIRPRFMVWENVPGAFTSNKGADFRAVLEETARVADFEAPDVPVPEKGWPAAGCLMGGGFSIAWRVFDAQFWGTPQRRRRIALVADFGGRCAPEVLFERKSVPGDSEPGRTEGKAAAGTAAEGSGADRCRRKSVYNFKAFDNITPDEISTTLLAHGGPYGGGSENLVVEKEAYICGNGQACNSSRISPVAGTLNCMHDQQIVLEKEGGRYTVRRLTPLECERLQGYPDG